MTFPASTPAEQDLVHSLIATATMLRTAVLCGSQCEYSRKLSEWMKTLAPGNLVVEMTQHGLSAERIGIVVKIEDRDVCEHEADDCELEKCENCGADDRWHEHYVWIEHTSGFRHRWANAEFVRIPRNTNPDERPRGVW
jgi:hypothetical protein